MTDRHIFHDHTTLVVRSLRGLVAAHPYLNLIPSLKVVYRADHDRSKVSLICGGGSGHEPGTTGFVGQGLLSASAAGDVFASPSAKQVGAAIKAVPSDKGTILIITNCECEGIGRASAIPTASGGRRATGGSRGRLGAM
jgi:dihydroxyacetone kinase